MTKKNIFCDSQCIVKPFCMSFISQNVLNWSLENDQNFISGLIHVFATPTQKILSIKY
jgi:hypothetical protein